MDERAQSPARRSRSPPRRRDRSHDRDRDDRPRDADHRRTDDRDSAAPSKPSNARGFKWKERRPRDDDREDRYRGPDRGYRNRSPRRDRDRERDRDRDRDRYDDRRDGGTSSRSAPPSSSRDEPSARRRDGKDDTSSKKRDKKPPPAAPANSGEPMIIVTVNDRLGTKAKIPCFASDRVKEFKILVAAQIGREPHEIMLKRQGERPFKDQLTLEDYGVSNGVQLDLEVDTGD